MATPNQVPATGALHQLHIPEDEWSLPRTRQLLLDRNLTGLYRLARRYGYSQTRIAEAVGKSQPQVSEIMNAPTPHRAASVDVLHRHADAFRMPLHSRLLLLGLSSSLVDQEAERIDRRDEVKRRELFRAAAALATTGAANWNHFSSRMIARISDRDFMRWFAWELHSRKLDEIDSADLSPELSEWAVAEASLPGTGFVRYDPCGQLRLVDPALKDILIAQALSADIVVGEPARLATVQTTHSTDGLIREFVSSDRTYEEQLKAWMESADDPVLRVNCAGVLAKLDDSESAENAVHHLAHDVETRTLYITAVASRVLHLDWALSQRLARMTAEIKGNPRMILPEGTLRKALESLSTELFNPKDAGARWCSVAMLSALKDYDVERAQAILYDALSGETSREVLQAIGKALAGKNTID